MSISILYEDNHIIAAVKPAGVLSQGDKTGDESMLELVKAYLKEKYKKPGNVFVGLLHRLDRPVSGIMLFAKTSKGASRLSEQFRNREVEKTYHALVTGKPKQKETLINMLEGQEAVLHYELATAAGGVPSKGGIKTRKYSLLKITIEGGKYHQIRQQLSLAGLPIVGDLKYGGTPWHAPKTIALAATGISFKTATGDNLVNLEIAIPFELGDND